MKVKIRRINKNHDLKQFMVDFSTSDCTCIILDEYTEEYKNDWSMYISMVQAAKRSKLNVTIHRIGGVISIEKV